MKMIILAVLLLICAGVYFREDLQRWLRKQAPSPSDKGDTSVIPAEQAFSCARFAELIAQKRKELQELEAAAKEFATAQANASAELLKVIG